MLLSEKLGKIVSICIDTRRYEFSVLEPDPPRIEAFSSPEELSQWLKANLYAIADGLTITKCPETRHRRFDKFMDMLARGEKPKKTS